MNTGELSGAPLHKEEFKFLFLAEDSNKREKS